MNSLLKKVLEKQSSSDVCIIYKEKCLCGQLGMAIRFGNHIEEDLAPTLATSGGDNKLCVVYREKKFFDYVPDEITGTIRQKSGSYGGGSENLVIEDEYVIRRLTPIECERLQGYPDDYTLIDGYSYVDKKGKERYKKTTDSYRYTALGNSICLPCWVDVLKRIASYSEEDQPTMCSLFDGLGGFPLIWEKCCGGKAVWASEIEPYCIAVTKYHFGEE